MGTVYIVLRKQSGEMALGKTYSTKRDAKLALKHNIYRNNWPLYAIASVQIVPTVVSTIDDNGNWTEVSE